MSSTNQNQPNNDFSKLAANADLINKAKVDLEAINHNGPYFDKMVSKNVTALLGKTCYLTCRVKNLGNRTVSIVILCHNHKSYASLLKSFIFNVTVPLKRFDFIKVFKHCIMFSHSHVLKYTIEQFIVS